MQRPERRTDRLVQGLGVGSLGLAVPLLWRTDSVARTVGVDDSAVAPGVIRAVGARELMHGALLLLGPRRAVWTRVAGDVLDLAALTGAMSSREGERRTRASAATVAVAGVTALDLYVAVRTARAQHRRGRPGPLVLHASVTVNRSPDEVYAFWRDLANLPTFMLHLVSVSETSEGRTRWVAQAPLGRSVSWEAELTGDDPGRRLSWKSVPGSTIDNAGTVHFAPAPGDRGTEVRVALHYDVPGGRLGRAVARLFGEEPGQLVRDDLRRFKQVMETGDVVRSDALPHGTDARHQFAQGPAKPAEEEKSRSSR